MGEKERARRTIRIRHVHNPQTPEQKQDNFNRAVEKVRDSGLSPEQQAVRIERLRSAYLGVELAPQGDIYTAGCSK